MTKIKTHYGVSDQIHRGDYYDALNTFTYDIPFYLKEAKKARGPVLELCCGTGRITLPLAKSGVQITGVDISPSMLSHAKEKAANVGVKIPFHRADMKSLRLRQKFKLIFIPFNSLQNTYSLSDIEKVFQTVHRHLAPGGRFIFNVFNPSIEYMVKLKKLQKRKYRFTLKDGTKVSIDEICSYDSAGQVNRVTWYHRVGNQKPSAEQLDMRCFYPQEIDALLKYNDFKIIAKHGSFDRKAFSSESMSQIFVCKATV